jgi:hypothetical protein
MLIHSAKHRYGAKTQNDAGQWTHASNQTLTRVRFEPSTKLVKTKDNNEVQLSAVMFFDCRNSGPADTTFMLGDEIERVDGSTYEIVGGTEPIFDGNRAHHFEVELL